MLGKMLENVRKENPLIDCITNYVTVNDCANILLACGGSPIMCDVKEEVEEIVSICSGLSINIGTLGQSIPAMFLGGRKANEKNIPVILDPVGAGASKLRTETSNKIISDIKCAVIRGNMSEIKALAKGDAVTKGVDADASDTITRDNLQANVNFAKDFAKKTGSVIVITGAIDIVADENKAYAVHNGHPIMAKITGSGCMLTVVLAAFLAANKTQPLEAAAAAVCAMGLCGEKAFDKTQRAQGGTATFRMHLIDEMSLLTPQKLEEGAKYEIK